jgi:nucleotide-binding universal stress UspA family protein
VDKSAPSEAALSHALAVARACGARLTILHVLEAPGHYDPSLPELSSANVVELVVRRRETDAYLEQVAKRSGDVAELATTIIEGDAATQICQWAASNSVDLAIVATHGGKGRTRWSLASTARKLVEGLPCSVLVVPADGGAQRRDIRYARVLVPLDGSPWSETALALARQLAESCNAELVLAHAVPRAELTCVVPLTPEDLDLARRLAERNLRVARDYLDHLRARLSAAGLSVRTALIPGVDVREGLLQIIAREEPDLIVLSARGSSANVEQPLGSVATYLLTHAVKPLLILRPSYDRTTARETTGHKEAFALRLPAQAGV